jgi:GDP-D-mannose dehydratase
MKKALITGITGQDGSYLAELSPNGDLSAFWNLDANRDWSYAKRIRRGDVVHFSAGCA